MTETIAIMQPTYLPWLGYFDLIDQSQTFVFLDDVQLEKSSWQVRNKVKYQDHECILSVNRKKNKNSNTLSYINETILNDQQNWRYKHIKTIEASYQKAPFFIEVFPIISHLINCNTSNLSYFNINIIKYIAERIGIKGNFILSSDILLKSPDKTQRLIDICNKFKAAKYISPLGSLNYLIDENSFEIFKKSSIELLFQSYNHPLYQQLGKNFLSHMSIVDLLFNYGFNSSLDIIRSGRKKPLEYIELVKK